MGVVLKMGVLLMLGVMPSYLANPLRTTQKGQELFYKGIKKIILENITVKAKTVLQRKKKIRKQNCKSKNNLTLTKKYYILENKITISKNNFIWTKRY